jgi:hypothetical protein
VPRVACVIRYETTETARTHSASGAIANGNMSSHENRPPAASSALRSPRSSGEPSEASTAMMTMAGSTASHCSEPK